MPAWPDAASVHEALARLWRGRLTSAAIDGVAVGLALGGAVALGLGHFGPPSVTRLLTGVLFAVFVTASGSLVFVRSRRQALPAEIERRAPGCDNLVVTAAELLDEPARVRSDIGALICRHAAVRLGQLETTRVFPLRPALGRAAGAAVLCVAALGLARLHPTGATADGRRPDSSLPVAIRHITVTVHPPEYSGLADRTLRDPTNIEALAGSRLNVAVDAEAAAVELETMDGRLALQPSHGGFDGAVTVTRDGFLSFAPTRGEATGAHRSIGLIADPDHPPLVRLTEPGKDLFVADGNRQIAVALQAEDDLALASLRLTYTKVSGSGENFTFGEGEVPLTITKTDDRHWSSAARWNLAPLALVPGDMVVYRGLAADHRPGAPPVESDAFIVQVLTPNQADLGGFAVDEDPNKYALSQRMVILKTERLLAKKATLAASDYADEALGIGAEERQVRAMFIFMLGGEFEDAAIGDQLNEVAEAESEGDIAAGRLRNQARVDLAAATRKMSSASALLSVPDVAPALADEKTALDAIQRAFSKDRYLLRALSVQERVDLTRRLGGTLTGLAQGPRPIAAPEPPATTTTLRRLLARLAAERTDESPMRPTRLAAIADDCRRADPASPALRDVAALVGQMAAASASDAPAALDRATAALAAIVRASSPDAPTAPSSDVRRLGGALADAGRGGGSR
jgi:hypothetical protein